MHQHLIRWLKASVAKHFDDRTSSSIKTYIEGEKRDTNKFPNWIEVRMDGPFVVEQVSGIYKVNVDINILIGTIRDERHLYQPETNTGLVAAAFSNSISIYKFGDQNVDDRSFVDCIYLKQGTRDPLANYNIGESRPAEDLNQFQVEGHYYNSDFNMED